MKYRPSDIFTPQGLLDEVEKNPNLDFLLNIFNISRAFGVSGFGIPWSVGKHSVAAAFIALYWSRYNNYSETKRNKLVLEALVHDLHEAVTGDILPMFKTSSVKTQLDKIQTNILRALDITCDKTHAVDLKIIDLVAFLYEITQVSPSILHAKKLKLATAIAKKQLEILLGYCKTNNVPEDRIRSFLKSLEIFV